MQDVQQRRQTINKQKPCSQSKNNKKKINYNKDKSQKKNEIINDFCIMNNDQCDVSQYHHAIAMNFE